MNPRPTIGTEVTTQPFANDPMLARIMGMTLEQSKKNTQAVKLLPVVVAR